jgi:hypothetical protein
MQLSAPAWSEVAPGSTPTGGSQIAIWGRKYFPVLLPDPRLAVT